MQRILLVEDDPAIARSMVEFLRSEGFALQTASGQREAETLLGPGAFELLLVDVSLTNGSGYGVCASAKQYGLPVIFVTASGDESSVVAGLDMGADDYIAKPFRPRELVSRVRSVLRRCGSQNLIMLGNLRVDTDKATVTKNGAELSLSALEYRILLIFLSNRGRVLPRSRLLEEIWDVAGDYVNDNTLTVYIKRLREKLEDDPQNPQLLKTVRGIGYRMDE